MVTPGLVTPCALFSTLYFETAIHLLRWAGYKAKAKASQEIHSVPFTCGRMDMDNRMFRMPSPLLKKVIIFWRTESYFWPHCSLLWKENLRCSSLLVIVNSDSFSSGYLTTLITQELCSNRAEISVITAILFKSPALNHRLQQRFRSQQVREVSQWCFSTSECLFFSFWSLAVHCYRS